MRQLYYKIRGWLQNQRQALALYQHERQGTTIDVPIYNITDRFKMQLSAKPYSEIVFPILFQILCLFVQTNKEAQFPEVSIAILYSYQLSYLSRNMLKKSERCRFFSDSLGLVRIRYLLCFLWPLYWPIILWHIIACYTFQ